MARKAPERQNNTPAPWWKRSRLGKIPLRNPRVAQKITNGCGPPSRTRRPTLIARSVFLNWRRARWTASFMAITIMLILHNLRKPSPRNLTSRPPTGLCQSQLPFGDRQDFEDAMRGFIATTPDPGNRDRWAFLEHEAPPTVNPSLGVRRNSTPQTDYLRSLTAFIRFAVSRRRI